MGARIIAVVGAGGKSTLIARKAGELAAAHVRAAVTTTTHIYRPEGRPGMQLCEGSRALVFPAPLPGESPGEIPEALQPPCDVIGIPEPDGVKLSAPDTAGWSAARERYDVLLVEADGSRHFPVKVPGAHEPVIPEGTEEIIVVMGAHGEGRLLGEACFRASLLADAGRTEGSGFAGAGDAGPVGALLTKETIRRIAEDYYVTPLSEMYPDASCRFVYSDMFGEEINRAASRNRRPALVLLSSGAGRRFGENKLLAGFEGRPLYSFVLQALTDAKRALARYGIRAETIVVSCYPEILGAAEKAGAKPVENPEHSEGIASSVRAGARAAAAEDCDSVLFFAGDMPHFPAQDLVNLVREFYASGKSAACAFSDHPSNPGIFSAELYPFLFSLSGDAGPASYFRAHPSRVHFYPVAAEKLLDIDTRQDILAAAKDGAAGDFIA